MKHGVTSYYGENVGQSFEHIGFGRRCDQGLEHEQGERGWARAKALFAQPEEDKRDYHAPGGGGKRGYTPLGTEIARDATENDLKEFWHIGRDLPPGHPFTAAMPANIWPSEIEEIGRAHV